ncbi:unnamed protein product, partial [Amoebophrya sp. A25]|eukprot:GSA25T00010311001.1
MSRTSTFSQKGNKHFRASKQDEHDEDIEALLQQASAGNTVEQKQSCLAGRGALVLGVAGALVGVIVFIVLISLWATGVFTRTTTPENQTPPVKVPENETPTGEAEPVWWKSAAFLEQQENLWKTQKGNLLYDGKENDKIAHSTTEDDLRLARELDRQWRQEDEETGLLKDPEEWYWGTWTLGGNANH